MFLLSTKDSSESSASLVGYHGQTQKELDKNLNISEDNQVLSSLIFFLKICLFYFLLSDLPPQVSFFFLMGVLIYLFIYFALIGIPLYKTFYFLSCLS